MSSLLEIGDINKIKVDIIRSENPHPLIIAGITIILIICIYLVFIYRKQSVSGIWNDKKNTYTIKHNPIMSTLHITNKKNTFTGYVHGNIIYIQNKNKQAWGINNNKIIKWDDNTTWTRQ